MPAPKNEPAWVEPFLAALARTGNVRVSAEAAGVDVSNVYNRRSRHADFREAWARVLREREERAGGVGMANSADRTPPSCSAWSPSPATAGEENQLVPRTTATGAKLARPGRSRWSDAAQERFLIELGMCANVKRSAQAAGFSQEACYKRRLKDRNFAAAWDAALELGKTRVQAYLIEAATRTFDPDELPVGEGSGELPRVTISEAIHIARLKGAGEDRKAGPGAGRAVWSWEDAEPPAGWEPAANQARERIIERLERLRQQEDARKRAEGWSWDEGHEAWVPPGWARVVERSDEIAPAIASSAKRQRMPADDRPRAGSALPAPGDFPSTTGPRVVSLD